MELQLALSFPFGNWHSSLITLCLVSNPLLMPSILLCSALFKSWNLNSCIQSFSPPFTPLTASIALPAEVGGKQRNKGLPRVRGWWLVEMVLLHLPACRHWRRNKPHVPAGHQCLSHTAPCLCTLVTDQWSGVVLWVMKFMYSWG